MKQVSNRTAAVLLSLLFVAWMGTLKWSSTTSPTRLMEMFDLKPNSEQQQQQQQQQSRRHLAHSEVQRKPILIEDSQLDSEMSALSMKLNTPRDLLLSNNTKVPIYTSQQFLHLHHMKTGGTSIDRLLQCARDRLQSERELRVPYGSIHECSKIGYEHCKSGIIRGCKENLAKAAVMSYCAPLKDLPYFDWGTFDKKKGVGITVPPSQGAITVLRHPVDRVWSMFRFQTRNCFKCMPLTEIYQMIDSGKLNELEPTCYQQLQNHQVANLLSSEWHHLFDGTNSAADTADDEAMVEEAIKNMKSFFTVIGLTEQLNASVAMFGHVFPWMNETVEWSKQKCALGHANSSPMNNRCGKNFSHWDLPDKPDEKTRAAIEAHNQLDLKLYAAAVDHFEFQKKALRFDEQDQ